MKKIISLVVTLSLVITMFASVTAFAEVPAGVELYQDTENNTNKVPCVDTNGYGWSAATKECPAEGFDSNSDYAGGLNYIKVTVNGEMPENTRYLVLEGEYTLFGDVSYFNPLLYCYQGDTTSKTSGLELKCSDEFKSGDKVKLTYVLDITGRNVYTYIDGKLYGAAVSLTYDARFVSLIVRTGYPKNASAENIKIQNAKWKQRFFGDSFKMEDLGLYGGKAVWDASTSKYTIDVNTTQLRVYTGNGFTSAVNFNAGGDIDDMLFVAGYDENDVCLFATPVNYNYSGGLKPVEVSSPKKASTIKLFMFFRNSKTVSTPNSAYIPQIAPMPVQNIDVQ